MESKEPRIDRLLIFTLGSLFIISLAAVYSGSGQYQQGDPHYFVIRQLIWYLFGILILGGTAWFDYELLEKLSAPLYMFGIFLLGLVHFFGKTQNGSQRWLNLGIFDLQPSEFMKIFLLLYLASLFNKAGEIRLSFKKSFILAIKVIAVTFIPFFFVFSQPDLGSALVMAAASVGLLIVSPISRKMMALLLAGGTSTIAFLIYMYHYQFEKFTTVFKPHQLGRIYGWLNPHEYASGYGYQLQQSLLGIGSGQLTGKGFNEGQQIQSGKIPETHTDFIFAVIGEEFGFLGASLVICIYFVMMARIIKIALSSNRLFGVYICVGTVSLLGFQVFQNAAMTVGLMPITGLALPFISYGGSALLTNMIALGLVFSVNAHSSNYMFEKEL